jgi:UDP-N-acetylglucosamine 2-epimerase (non-hydrolysing)
LADHCSDYLFAPTEQSKKNLLDEGIPEKNISVVGNTVVDAIIQNREIANHKMNALNHLDLTAKNYFLVTVHRQENVDTKKKIQQYSRGFKEG